MRAAPATYREGLVGFQGGRSVTVEVVEQPEIHGIDTCFQRNLGPPTQFP